MKTGIELIAIERQEQIEKHGRSVKRDIIENNEEQIRVGAEHLLMKDDMLGINSEEINDMMPDGWEPNLWFKMFNKNYKERLIIAGALIAAEIDRIQAIE